MSLMRSIKKTYVRKVVMDGHDFRAVERPWAHKVDQSHPFILWRICLHATGQSVSELETLSTQSKRKHCTLTRHHSESCGG